MLLNHPQFFDEERLLDQKPLLPMPILDPNCFAGKLLKFEQLRLGGETSWSQLPQSGHISRSHVMRRWKLLPKCQSYLAVGVAKNLNEFREQFITNRG